MPDPRRSPAARVLDERQIPRGVSEAEGPRPMEYDARGFPIPQPMPAFSKRVARLMGGS